MRRFGESIHAPPNPMGARSANMKANVNTSETVAFAEAAVRRLFVS